MPILIDAVIAITAIGGIGYLFYKLLIKEKDKDLERRAEEIKRKDAEIERLKKDQNWRDL
jgi:ribosomal protein S13